MIISFWSRRGKFHSPFAPDFQGSGIKKCVQLYNILSNRTPKPAPKVKKEESGETKEERLRRYMSELEVRDIPYKVCNADVGHIQFLNSLNRPILDVWSNTDEIYCSFDRLLSEDKSGILEAIEIYEHLPK